MILDYIKYLYSTRTLISYKVYKNSVRWGETALYAAKALVNERRKLNSKAFKQIKSKNLPVVTRNINKHRGSYIIQQSHGKSLSQIAEENQLFINAHRELFADEYLKTLGHYRLLDVLNS